MTGTVMLLDCVLLLLSLIFMVSCMYVFFIFAHAQLCGEHVIVTHIPCNGVQLL